MPPAGGHDDGMQIQRALQYARCAAVLNSDPDVPSEGMIDQALTNGLAVIVADEWPGEEANARPMHAANTLLDVIEQHSSRSRRRAPHTVGEIRRPRPEPVSTWPLRHGVTETQGVRHARGTGTLERAHVDALVALDDHPALRRIGEVTSDGQWVNEKIADSYEQQRAEEYLIFIGDEEADERAKRAPDRLCTYHPGTTRKGTTSNWATARCVPRSLQAWHPRRIRHKRRRMPRVFVHSLSRRVLPPDADRREGGLFLKG